MLYLHPAEYKHSTTRNKNITKKNDKKGNGKTEREGKDEYRVINVLLVHIRVVGRRLVVIKVGPMLQ